ncbi:MAG: hypothetical protein COY80_01985 [Candidatus Pacebacteria bacterium CG_4_10_14_0_8_um_filter_42_14]|nr:MAG: hypothetical protein COY80_01985 [Candidatus Pacebacteria bacterium CG_4_10_14_0_8_um_filter_42_14]
MQSTRLGQFTVYLDHSEEFHSLKREIFSGNAYYLELENLAPNILDGGAHIGLFTLYYKQLYPAATITAVEPLAENIVLLEQNIFENQLEGVTTDHVALADHDGAMKLYFDATPEKWFSTAGLHNGAWSGAQKSDSRTVPTKTLSSYLREQKFDLVKLDIEGAELGVIAESKALLSRSDQYLIEFHPRNGSKIEQLEKIFTDRGFKVQSEKTSRAGLQLLHAWS